MPVFVFIHFVIIFFLSLTLILNTVRFLWPCCKRQCEVLNQLNSVFVQGTTWVQEIVWQIYHNGEINSGKIEDRVPFVEEATNPKSTQPDIKTLPSPRLLKTHLSYEAIPKAKNKDISCKYIYIARNPKDAAVSSYKFMKSLGSSTGLNAPWEYYVKLFIEGKSKHITFQSFVCTDQMITV